MSPPSPPPPSVAISINASQPSMSTIPTTTNGASHTESLSTFFLSFLVFAVLYHILAPLYDSAKKRSWIITAIASFITSLCSVPFLIVILKNNGSFPPIDSISPPLLDFAVKTNRLFQGYMVADLVLGAIYYRAHVQLATGWIHHFAYLLLVQFAIIKTPSYSPIFSAALFMEIPTFFLALGSLNAARRSDIIFATTFFTTRIFFHISLILLFTFPSASGRRAVHGQIAPAILLTLALPMHVVWFTGCVKGFIKRAKARKEVTAVAAISAKESAIQAESTLLHSYSETTLSSTASTPALLTPELGPTEADDVAPLSLSSPNTPPTPPSGLPKTPSQSRIDVLTLAIGEYFQQIRQMDIKNGVLRRRQKVYEFGRRIPFPTRLSFRRTESSESTTSIGSVGDGMGEDGVDMYDLDVANATGAAPRFPGFYPPPAVTPTTEMVPGVDGPPPASQEILVY